MTVFYTPSGRAYHYYHDCHQLTNAAPNALQTAAATELDHPPCHTCLTRRTLVESIS